MVDVRFLTESSEMAVLAHAQYKFDQNSPERLGRRQAAFKLQCITTPFLVIIIFIIIISIIIIILYYILLFMLCILLRSLNKPMQASTSALSEIILK